VGAEIEKIRPALVISPQSIGRLPLRIVVPITDWKRQYEHFPWFVNLQPTRLNGLDKESGADGFQVKSVSILRFVEKLGILRDSEIDDIASAIVLAVGAP
jgi:mRNA interferase MazF